MACILETAEDIKIRYSYIFGPDGNREKLIPRIILQPLEGDRGETIFLDIPIKYVSYEQAHMKVNGYQIGDFAYISDIRDFPDTIYEDLKGVKTLVLSALRFEASQFHLGIDEAVQFANKVGAQHTWLTHIAHEQDHEATNQYLPSNVRMAYDGLELNFEIEA